MIVLHTCDKKKDLSDFGCFYFLFKINFSVLALECEGSSGKCEVRSVKCEGSSEKCEV